MSGKVVGWAMEQRTGSSSTKLVLVKLADNANEEGFCWPSVAHIANHTELCERSVREQLRKLEAAGLISVDTRITDAGRQTSNAYQLNLSAPANVAVTAPDAHKAEPDAAPPRQDVHPNIEPSVEPSSNRRGLRSEDRASLTKRFGQGIVHAWFSTAEIVPGPPPQIWVETRCIASNVEQKFGIHLRDLFGDALEIKFRVESTHNPAKSARRFRAC